MELTNEDIRGKSVDEIKLLLSRAVTITLTDECMLDSFNERNLEKLRFLESLPPVQGHPLLEKIKASVGYKSKPLSLPGYLGYYIDVATEEGDIEMVKYLVSKGAVPSLYSKQMATINGHDKTVFTLDMLTSTRNNVGIHLVHYRRDSHKRLVWDSVVPESARVF